MKFLYDFFQYAYLGIAAFLIYWGIGHSSGFPVYTALVTGALLGKQHSLSLFFFRTSRFQVLQGLLVNYFTQIFEDVTA